MLIGLVDVDGHNYPNLCLMKISSYHKALGDHVEWHQPEKHYDIVYMSKVFSDAYSPDYDKPVDAEQVFRGGGQDMRSRLSMEERSTTNLRIRNFPKR